MRSQDQLPGLELENGLDAFEEGTCALLLFDWHGETEDVDGSVGGDDVPPWSWSAGT